MQASKTPAYVALVSAVALGAALSSAIHPQKPSAPPAEVQQTAANVLPESTPAVSREETVSWKQTVLNWQNVRLQLEAPLPDGATPSCRTPTGGEDEVGTCYQVVPGQSPVLWRIATVTQRDRFVPAKWFADAQSAIKSALQPQQVADMINADLATSWGFSLTNVSMVNSTTVRDGIAIKGQATYRPDQTSTNVVTMTCLVAFVLAANRPSQVLYCTANADDAEKSGARLVASLRKLNPSFDVQRNSLQAIERTTYQRYLKTHGGTAANPEVVQGEIEHFAATTADCQTYGAISQERYLCNEQHAKARMDQLSSLSARQ
ncbi:hypothetical protein OKW30_002553 [Paraburkholderia sp. Clong3]|uniref:hypothetical protein n=1 Tax=Paraburkholderia sp. Clong3 TaxID=2991061 RepID=UPI003D19135A